MKLSLKITTAILIIFLSCGPGSPTLYNYDEIIEYKTNNFGVQLTYQTFNIFYDTSLISVGNEQSPVFQFFFKKHEKDQGIYGYLDCNSADIVFDVFLMRSSDVNCNVFNIVKIKYNGDQKTFIDSEYDRVCSTIGNPSQTAVITDSLYFGLDESFVWQLAVTRRDGKTERLPSIPARID